MRTALAAAALSVQPEHVLRDRGVPLLQPLVLDDEDEVKAAQDGGLHGTGASQLDTIAE